MSKVERPFTTDIPWTRQLSAKHLASYGHALAGVWVREDGELGWTMEQSCCDEGAAEWR